MPDDRTVEMQQPNRGRGMEQFLSRFEAKVVIVSGPASGTQYSLEQPCQTMGRGPGVDLIFDDPAMSKQHAAFEFAGDGFRIRDLGSTNGLFINGEQAQEAELRHGDRLEIGGQEFRFLLQERDETPTYELPSEV